MATSKLAKGKYKPLTIEPDLFKTWQEEELYRFDSSDPRPLFSIDTPPPYSNASWHMGGAIHYNQIDMIARYKRMTGFNVLFPMCLDRNGLPIEIETEKKFKIRMREVPRDDFLAKCQSLLDIVGAQILDVCHSLGLSCDSFVWEEFYKTDEPQYRAFTQSTFIELWHKGLIYEDSRPNNYDFSLGTTISDAEIEYVDGTHSLYEVIFRVKDSDEQLVIATTRPELIPAIGVVIYHPTDERYQHLEGKTALSPLLDIEVPIMPHHSAEKDFGTGIMMVCSFGDTADIRLFRELGLEARYVIGLNGRMSENAGEFEGMKIKEARTKIAARLEEMGLIVSEKTVPHRYPISDRTKVPIEFIGMPEYYLKQTAFLDDLREHVDHIEWHPESSKQIWLDWMDRISIDWPISRRRFYGTEVPVWYCKSCRHAHVPEPGPYYQPWRDDPPFETCEKCGSTEGFEGDERTFDTWMDSSVSMIYTLLHPLNKRDDEFYEKAISRPYINDIRPQGKDIVRTWLHFSMLRGHQLMNKSSFKHVWISGHVVASSGEKMSKSKGNVVKPEPILARYGGDAVRLFGALEASHGSDMRCNVDRLKGLSKFLNKLKNIAYFISQFERPSPEEEIDYQPADQWLRSRLNSVLEIAMNGYDKLDFLIPSRALRAFIWDEFASQYLELVKARAYNNDDEFGAACSRGACATLYDTLDAVIKAFAPIIPFVTDYIFRGLYDRSVHLEQYPEPLEGGSSELSGEELMKVNQLIWKFKHDHGLSLRSPLKVAVLPESLAVFAEDLRGMHLVKDLRFGGDAPSDAEKIESDGIAIHVQAVSEQAVEE